MAAPRPLVLELEVCEDRTLLSGGGFHDHDRTTDSRAGWDTTPARVRTLDDTTSNDTPRQGSDLSPSIDSVTVTFVLTQTPAAPTPAPTNTTPNAANPTTSLAPAPQSEPFGGPARDEGTPESRTAPAETPRERPPVSAERPTQIALVMMSGTRGYDGDDSTDSPPTDPRPIEPIPAPAPRTVLPLPFEDWLPIEVDLPTAVPLAGLLDLNAAELEAGVARLLDLTAGIEVEAVANDWSLWLATGAVLAGAAAYFAWTNQTRGSRFVSRLWERNDDTRLR